MTTSCEASLEKRLVKSATWGKMKLVKPAIASDFFRFCEGFVNKGALALFVLQLRFLSKILLSRGFSGMLGEVLTFV
jgi:hypothetical protein